LLEALFLSSHRDISAKEVTYAHYQNAFIFLSELQAFGQKTWFKVKIGIQAAG